MTRDRVQYDFSLLRGRIAQMFRSQSAFAREMGTPVPTLSRKLNNTSEFTGSEIDRAMQLLDIPGTDVRLYFFSPKNS